MALYGGCQQTKTTAGCTVGKLRMIPDQIFTEITATVGKQFLNLIPCDQVEFFEKLKNESGVKYENIKENEGGIILRGSLEQIILAKIKMEKFLVEMLHNAKDSSDEQVDGTSSSSSAMYHQLMNVNQSGTKNITSTTSVLPEKSKLLGINWKTTVTNSVDSSIPNSIRMDAVDKQNNYPLKSRRKVGRPRKIPLIPQPQPPPPPVASSEIEVPQTVSSTVIGSCSGMIREDNNAPLDARLRTTTCTTSSSSTVDNTSTKVNATLAHESNGEFRNGYDEVLKRASQWLSENSQPREMSFESYLEESRSKKIKKEGTPYKFSCEICSFKAHKEGQLLKHVLTHAKVGTTVHKCDKCDFASVSMNHFIRHRLSHSEAVFTCPQCTFQTDEAKQLARHVTMKHTLVRTPATRSSILQCSECPYNTTKIYHFERHLLVHNRDLKGLLQVYQCDECSYKTHRKEHYIRHKDVHIRRRLFECAQCNISFKTLEIMQQHQAAAHDMLSSSVMSANGISSDEILAIPGLATYLAETCGNEVGDSSSIEGSASLYTHKNEEDAGHGYFINDVNNSGDSVAAFIKKGNTESETTF